jgi:hypothetical protein
MTGSRICPFALQVVVGHSPPRTWVHPGGPGATSILTRCDVEHACSLPERQRNRRVRDVVRESEREAAVTGRIVAHWHCGSCDVAGRDPASEPSCWNCGGPVTVTARPEQVWSESAD